MRIRVAAVGQRMPQWVTEAWTGYIRRLPPVLNIELREIPLPRRGKNSNIRQAVNEEGAALLAAVPRDAFLVALDAGGRPWSTADLARRLEQWMGSGRDVCLLVGGPDGLAFDCLRRADAKWSLGPLTLPHPLVRVILAEQLYRAWTITSNHPYHRA
jgi:23S rRNA (pseudouridine1915-N3)-methyltransferase